MKRLSLFVIIFLLFISSNAYALDRDYCWFMSQYNTGTNSSINCGPACAVMSLKWAGIEKTVEEARESIKPDGGCWSTLDVQTYINDNGVLATVMAFPVDEDSIKTELDKSIFILCVDVGQLRYGSPNNIGHFIIVKDYCYQDQTLYLKVNDPEKGEIIYCYQDICKAVETRWPYAIEVSENEQPNL